MSIQANTGRVFVNTHSKLERIRFRVGVTVRVTIAVRVTVTVTGVWLGSE